MKMYKKSELSLVNGMLVAESGDIVVPSITIIEEANALETYLQKTMYLQAQPIAMPAPSLDGFQRKSIKDGSRVKFHAKTPMMDDKAKEAIDLMDELDDVVKVERANSMATEFQTLVEFAQNDFVIDCGGDGTLYFFDTPTLGNPLELTVDDVIDAIALVCEMVPEGLKRIDKEEPEEENDSLQDLLNKVDDFCKSVEDDKQESEE